MSCACTAYQSVLSGAAASLIGCPSVDGDRERSHSPRRIQRSSHTRACARACMFSQKPRAGSCPERRHALGLRDGIVAPFAEASDSLSQRCGRGVVRLTRKLCLVFTAFFFFCGERCEDGGRSIAPGSQPPLSAAPQRRSVHQSQRHYTGAIPDCHIVSRQCSSHLIVISRPLPECLDAKLRQKDRSMIPRRP